MILFGIPLTTHFDLTPSSYRLKIIKSFTIVKPHLLINVSGEWHKKMTYLLDPKNNFITQHELDELNGKISKVKFPHDLNGRITDLSQERLKRFKATEMQLFLLHALFPLLQPIFDTEIYVHHGLFVTAMQILNKDVCLDQDIANAQLLLDEYHKLNTEIYSRRYLTYTNHALIHLPDQRRAHGCPLVLLSNR